MARKLVRSHLKPDLLLAAYDESDFRQWSLYETIRRTTFLVNMINTLSCRMRKQDAYFYEALDDELISRLPLPAPESLWKADNLWDWSRAKQRFGGDEKGVASKDVLHWLRTQAADSAVSSNNSNQSGSSSASTTGDGLENGLDFEKLPEFTKLILATLEA
jgi:hypothetical protein